MVFPYKFWSSSRILSPTEFTREVSRKQDGNENK